MNQIARTEADAFKAGYARLAPALVASLPSHIAPEKFERAAMIAVQRTPDLLTKADRKSLFLSLQRAAQDGLMPDGREGAIVLFGNQAQWMPMVAGLMKLARNSGEIASISAHVAYEGEKFRVVLGDEETIEHERSLDLSDTAKPVAVYAVATLRNGEKVREVMTRAQVERVRNVSRAKNAGPWVQWWDQMALKTAIRRLSKRLPLSTDKDGDARLRSAIERDDEHAILDGRAEPETPQTASRLDMLEHAIADDTAPETGEVMQGEVMPAEGAPAADPEASPAITALIESIEMQDGPKTLDRMMATAEVKATLAAATEDERRQVDVAIAATRRGFGAAA